MPTPLLFDWSPERQRIALGPDLFEHEGPIPTRPEHDVAHLMLGWHGYMAWRPQGPRDMVCHAEFNAVYLEVLLLAGRAELVASGIGTATLEIPPLSLVLERAAGSTLEHMRWFVEQHYAPFPVPFGEALARFWASLKPERLERLLPLFWEARETDGTQRISRRLDLVQGSIL